MDIPRVAARRYVVGYHAATADVAASYASLAREGAALDDDGARLSPGVLRVDPLCGALKRSNSGSNLRRRPPRGGVEAAGMVRASSFNNLHGFCRSRRRRAM